MEPFEALLQLSEAFFQITVTLKIGSIGNLDKSLITFGQQTAEEQDIFLIHNVCNHRGAIIVGLNADLAEMLQGPAAGTLVHRFIEETANFLFFLWLLGKQ
jgi:hypothetical protein